MWGRSYRSPWMIKKLFSGGSQSMNAFKESRGIRKNSGESEALLSLIIADVLKTRETRQLMGELIPEIMRRWAGESSLKQRLTTPFEGYLKRKLRGDDTGKAPYSLSELFEDPQFADTMRRFLPEIVSGLVNALNATIKNAKAFSPEERDAFVTRIMTGLSQSSIGESLTLFCQTINEIHKEDPLYFTDKLEPGVTRLIESLDLGELREFVDNSNEDLKAFVKMLLGVLWKYPSKLVLLLTFITDIVNILTSSISQLLSVLNRISPDLLTDVVFSIFRGIDGRFIGQLIQEGAEMVRKFHAGNALIGEPGATHMATDLSRFIDEVAGAIDENIIYKAKLALLEEKESVVSLMRKLVKDDPVRFERRVQAYASEKNSHFHALTHRLTAIEGMPDNSIAEALEKATISLETEEAAEVVNLLTALVNRVRAIKPSMARELVARFVNTLDFSELREGVNGLSEELVDELTPMGRAIVPKLVSGICLALAPADDEFEEDAAMARNLLRSLLNGEEKVS